MEKNPAVVWQPQMLQRILATKNLGEVYWEKKAEWFRRVRKEINVRISNEPQYDLMYA